MLPFETTLNAINDDHLADLIQHNYPDEAIRPVKAPYDAHLAQQAETYRHSVLVDFGIPPDDQNTLHRDPTHNIKVRVHFTMRGLSILEYARSKWTHVDKKASALDVGTVKASTSRKFHKNEHTRPSA
eukprot:2553602-Prymnesium_polylepis.1